MALTNSTASRSSAGSTPTALPSKKATYPPYQGWKTELVRKVL